MFAKASWVFFRTKNFLNKKNGKHSFTDYQVKKDDKTFKKKKL